MKHLLLILITLCIVTPLSAQISEGVWYPFAAGVEGDVAGAANTVLNEELYILHDDPNSSDRMRLSKWNGTNWTLLNEFAYGGYIRQIEAYRGDIYAGGQILGIDTIQALHGLARWDGTKWERVDMGPFGNWSFNVMSMRVLDGVLYCAGEFASATDDGYATVIRFDGTEWSEVGQSPGKAYSSLGAALEIYNGELYLGGRYSTDSVHSLAKWDGNRWIGMPDGFDAIDYVRASDGKLFCYGEVQSKYHLKYWDGATWRNAEEGLETPGHNSRIYDLEVCNGELCAASGATRLGNVYRWDGLRWRRLVSFDGAVTGLVIFENRLCAAGLYKGIKDDAGGLRFNGVAYFCDARRCGAIIGTVFDDADVDCIHDAGERPMRRRVIEVTPGPYYAITDDRGAYWLHVDPGTYSVALLPHPYWIQNCPKPSPVHGVTIVNRDDAAEGVSFGVRRVAAIQDLRVSMTAGPARAGRSLIYSITYENAGTVTMDGTVRLFLDPRLAFDSSAPPPTRIQLPLLEWDFTKLEPGEERTITVWTTIPMTARTDDRYCSRVMIDPALLDAGIDNSDSVCVRVTGSYDPNDIAVEPLGIEEDGELGSGDSVLTYTVRFQNTGNDTAFRVVVIDTLSGHLDMRTVIPGAARHPYQFTMSGSNILIWTFDNIMLPDSGVDEPNSHGVFKYSVRLKPELPVGTTIENRAGIYFDYNAPVMTNTVRSTIGGALAIPPADLPRDAVVRPNPARTGITIAAEMEPGCAVELRDILGNVVVRRICEGGEMTLDLAALPAGIYFVKIPSRDGAIVRQIHVTR